MPTQREMQALVDEHRELDEPMTGAVWIRTSDPTAWLVEILPGLPDDPMALTPMVFAPNKDFRYALQLIAAPLDTLIRLLREAPEFALELHQGVVLFDSEDTKKLRLEAANIVQAAVQRGKVA